MPNQSMKSVNQRPEQFGKRNMFDLSHAWRGTFHLAELIPIVTEETHPGDTFFIGNEVFLRFAPLYLPIFHKLNMSVDYFYVPNRILWPGTKQNSWEYFIKAEDSVTLPTVNIPVDGVNDPSSVPCYMSFPTWDQDIPTGESISVYPVNALPMNAYLKIWDEYYRNDQVQSARWFELTTGDNTTAMSTAFGTLTFKALYRNWNRDLFTSLTPSPQVGADVLVPIMRNDTVDQLDPSWTYKGPTKWMKYDGTPAPTGPFYNNSGTNISGSPDVPIYLDIQETSATIRDLRFAVMMTEYLERAMRSGDRYRDFMWSFFESDPDPLMVDRPKWIGGKRGRVSISEVMSQAETENSGGDLLSAVGDYAGQMLAIDNLRPIKYSCYEHGFIIGLLSVFPTSSYYQGMRKMWTRTNKYDYPWEQFQLIGDEEVLQQEVNMQWRTSMQGAAGNTKVFAYGPRYNDWRYRNDTIAGMLRESGSPFFSWHMARQFTQGSTPGSPQPPFNSEFITCQPMADGSESRVFRIDPDDPTNDPPVIAYIWNDIKVIRRLAKFGIPAL